MFDVIASFWLSVMWWLLLLSTFLCQVDPCFPRPFFKLERGIRFNSFVASVLYLCRDSGEEVGVLEQASHETLDSPRGRVSMDNFHHGKPVRHRAISYSFRDAPATGHWLSHWPSSENPWGHLSEQAFENTLCVDIPSEQAFSEKKITKTNSNLAQPWRPFQLPFFCFLLWLHEETTWKKRQQNNKRHQQRHNQTRMTTTMMHQTTNMTIINTKAITTIMTHEYHWQASATTTTKRNM